MDIKKEAEKEIERIEKIINGLELIDNKGSKLHELIKAYFSDAKDFHKKEMFLQAFEAAIICWAYVDAGLHLGAFKVSEDLKSLFTL